MTRDSESRSKVVVGVATQSKARWEGAAVSILDFLQQRTNVTMSVAQEEALVEFLCSFSLTNPPSNLLDLNDGVGLFEALSEM